MSFIPRINSLTPRQQNLHLIIDTPSREDKMSPTVKKVFQLASILLMILGVTLIVGGGACFGIGAAAVAGGSLAAGISAILLSTAPTMIPLGLTSLLSGCHMLFLSEKGSFGSKTLGISDLLTIK